MNNAPILVRAAEEFCISNGYSNPNFVGKGAFKETYSAVNSEGTRIAIKLIDAKKQSPSRTEREIKAMLECDSPLIARLYDYGDYRSSSFGLLKYSVEEYLDGGTLTAKLEKQGLLAPKRVVKYGKKLTSAIVCLKEHELVHRDIKPDNIMFRKNKDIPILVDLGLVRILSDYSLTPSWADRGPGTAFYSSAEQLNNEKNLISWRTDQFSLGVVLCICLCGKHPYYKQGIKPYEIVERVAERKEISESILSELKTQGCSWIVRMVAQWPVQRFQSAKNLLETIALEN